MLFFDVYLQRKCDKWFTLKVYFVKTDQIIEKEKFFLLLEISVYTSGWLIFKILYRIYLPGLYFSLIYLLIDLKDVVNLTSLFRSEQT